jgi:excisionase family DNA binding protein
MRKRFDIDSTHGHAAGSQAVQRAASARRSVLRLSFRPEQAAESTGFSRTRIFQAIREGELSARKDGKATVIEVAELQRWLRTLPIRGREPETAAERQPHLSTVTLRLPPEFVDLCEQHGISPDFVLLLPTPKKLGMPAKEMPVAGATPRRLDRKTEHAVSNRAGSGPQ